MPGDPLAPGRAILADVAAGDVMTRPAVVLDPETPLAEVVVRMAASRRRALPVVTRGFPVGIVTPGDVVARGTGAAAPPGDVPLDAHDAEALVDRIVRSARIARDVMTPDPVTVAADVPLRGAAELMARRRLKRLPVVDRGGRLAGVLSRVDVLRAVAGGGWDAADPATPSGLDATTPVRAAMRTDVTAVSPDAPLDEVLPLVAASGLDHVIVVDGERRVLGGVSDSALLDRLAPPVRRGVFAGSIHGLAFGHSERERAERSAAARTAADVLAPLVTAAADLPLGEAIALVLGSAQKIVAVVDEGGRLVGALDRASLLRGLVPAIAAEPSVQRS